MRPVTPNAAKGNKFDVLFVLMEMGTFGGVIDVIEIINRLVLRGYAHR